MPIQQSTRGASRADLGEAFHEYSSSEMKFVADLCLPIKQVPKMASTIGVVRRENARIDTYKHANGGAYPRVTLTTEDASYACEDHGLEAQLTDQDRSNYASDFDAELETVQFLKTKLKFAREVRVATALFNTTTWDTGTSELYTDVTGDWDAAGSDVIGHVGAAIEQVRKNTGIRADSMVIGPVTFKNLKANTAILSRFVAVPVLTPSVWQQFIAEILDLKNLFVADGSYNSAAEGQDVSMADVWSDDYALVFKKQTESMANPGLGRIMEWIGEDGNYANGLENIVQYREQQTKSDIFQGADFSDEFIIDPYFGHLLSIDT